MKILKKLLIVLFLSIFPLLIPINVNAQQVSIVTPRGVITSTNISTNLYDIDDIEEFRNEDFDAYPDINEVAPANSAYNCASYALYSRDYTTNNHWITMAEDYILGEFNFNNETYVPNTASYVESDFSPGDILVYYDNYSLSPRELDIIHVAVIYSNNNHVNPVTAGDNDLIVISKWATHGLYIHDFRDCEFYSGAVSIISYRPYYDLLQTISTNNTYLNYSFTITNKYRKIVKLVVQNEMDISINVSSTNGSVNASFYDDKMQLIDDCLIRYNNTYSGSYIYHLNQGVYYYSVYFENPNVTGTISTKVRKLDSTFDNAIMLDPGTGYLVGSEISILSQYYSGVDLYGYNTIHNGFTRLLYFDSNLVLETSRLDYYYVTSNSDELFVTPYGTILAKNVDGYDNVMIYAFNKNDPSLVYRKNIIVNEYLGPDIYLSWDIHPYLYDEDYLYIEDEAPFNFLQYYYWYSTNSNVITVDSIGYYRCLSQGICYIYGDSIFNDKVHLQIYVTAG